MTDGAARVLELHLRQTTSNVVDKQLENAFNRLVSTDSNLAWTSGQWMTGNSSTSCDGDCKLSRSFFFKKKRETRWKRCAQY